MKEDFVGFKDNSVRATVCKIVFTKRNRMKIVETKVKSKHASYLLEDRVSYLSLKRSLKLN